MPERGGDFSGWLKSIQKIVEQIEIPVIVKEVGFEMSRETLRLLKEAGITYVDVSGRGGGANFIGIENARREKHEFEYLKNWVQSKPITLLETSSFTNEMNIFASDGIHKPLCCKIFCSCTKAAGLASPVLRLVQ